MSSRATRNTSKNVQRTPTPTPPLQSSPAKARKSFTRGSKASMSTNASIPSTSRSTSQARTAPITGGGPANKKLPKRMRSSSSDSSATPPTTSQLMRGRSSSDSEEDDQPLSAVSKSKKKQPLKRAQRKDSSSEGGSDTDYAPPAKDTVQSKKSISGPSGSQSTPSLNDRGRAKITKLDTPQASGVKGSPSKQTGYMKNLVNKCVFYLLVADQKKHAIKKPDILKNVFEDQSAKECYSIVLLEANKILKKTFGLEMLQLKNQKNSYIIINILDPDHGIQEFAEYSEDELQKKGLTFLLLTIIFMNQNAISEDKLWKALEPLGINPSSSAPHPVFGNVRKYITTELVKEMYLEYTRVNKDPVQYEFTWGERAYQEVQKKDLLEFACKIMGDLRPDDWKLQFMDAKPKPANSEA